ncbi:MAG: alpha/beta fold hydrolase [Planctomycetes bacterium]|nr:alpha/beta fold hydrolase [Planctomycetota bacterium]
MKRITNFALFQVGWFLAVGAAARGSMWAGVLAMAIVVAIHLALVADRKREAGYILVAGLIGTVADTVLSILGVIMYPTSEAVWTQWIVPPWISALWLGFATLPRFSLHWLVGRPWLAAAFGAIGGPLAFWGGMRLGAVAPKPDSVITWIVLAVEYAIATPLLLWLAPQDQARIETRARRSVRFVASGTGLVVVALACLTAGCVGMKKSEIEHGLRALPKNSGIVEAGLMRRVAPVTLNGDPQEIEYVWTHIRARAGERASRPPIVLVHGTPASLFNWALLLSAIDAAAGDAGVPDIYALDVIGHGLSQPKAAHYTFQTCAEHVRGFLEMLDLRDVTIVGQSYGGEFAWRVALDAPERVKKLVLIDSSGYQRADGEWLPEEEKLRNWPGAQFGYLLNSRDRLRPALQLHFSVPLRDDQLEEMFLLCENADNWRAMTHLCRDENGTRQSEIARIAQPTLLIWGARDIAYTPDAYGRRFERDIAGSQLVIVPEAGHYPHEEQPAAVSRALLDFHNGH